MENILSRAFDINFFSKYIFGNENIWRITIPGLIYVNVIHIEFLGEMNEIEEK